jgi:hypothetical protein
MLLKLPNRRKNPSSEQGQAVLIILLIMAVVLTVGLSIVSRSVTDIKISQQAQESARTFWVAQAGLEKAIKANSSDADTLNDVSYQVDRSLIGGSQSLIFPEKVKSDNPLTLWLVEHDDETGEINPDLNDDFAGSLITFLWGQEGDSALEATLIYYDSGPGEFRSRRYAATPSSLSGQAQEFEEARTSCPEIGGQTFPLCHTIDLSDLPVTAQPYFIRVKTFLSDNLENIGVSADQNLPSQGYCWDARATAQESKVSTRLRDCRLWRVMPSIFDYTLFSAQSM